MKKAQTLQIKQFLGIDRFVSNTLNDPRKFWSLKNLDSKNDGELSDIPGGSALFDSTLTASGKIFEDRDIYLAEFLRKTNGRESLLIAANAEYSLSSSLYFVSADFSTPTGGVGTTSHEVLVLYRGLGRTLAYNTFTPAAPFRDFVNRQSPGGITISATKLAALPDQCCEVVFYARSGANAFGFIGAYQRVNGVFSSRSLTCPVPRTQATGTNSIGKTPASTSTITSSYNANGTLIPGRTYYIGIAPYLISTQATTVSSAPATYSNNTLPVVTFKDAASPTPNVFAVTINDGDNSISCFFDGLTNPVAGNNIQSYMVFIGETPEDLMLAEVGLNLGEYDGRIIPTYMDYSTGPYTDLNTCSAVIQSIPNNSSLSCSAQYYDQVFAFSKDKVWASGTTSARDLVGLARFITCATRIANSSGVYTGVNQVCWFGVDPTATAFSITNTNIRHIMPQINALGYFVASDTATPDKSQRLEPVSAATPESGVAPWRPWLNNGEYNGYTVPFRDRLYIADNFSQLYYSDGLVLKPVIPNYQTWYAPIAKYITAFSNRLIVGGGQNYTITEGTPLYSNVNDPWGWTTTPAATPAPNNLFTNAGDNSQIFGFNIYSTNLSTTGPETFLVIGKESAVLMWTGDTNVGVKEISSNVGWASPRSYSLTNVGPVFVGSDANIYALLADSKIAPIGYAVQPLLKDSYTNEIFCVFHENNVKISYKDLNNNCKEIWFERRLTESGQLKSIFKGPHDRDLLTASAGGTFKYSSVFRNWGDFAISGTSFFKDFRVGVMNANPSGADRLYRLEASGVYASAASKVIEMTRLGLEADHNWKVIKDVYVASEISADTTFTAVMSGEDGVAAVTTSETQASTTARKLNQMQLISRFFSRVNTLTLTIVSTAAFKLFDVSLLFDVKKRRRL